MRSVGELDWPGIADSLDELVFPLEAVIGLDSPGVDSQGGEFVGVAQRARESASCAGAVGERSASCSTTPPDGRRTIGV